MRLCVVECLQGRLQSYQGLGVALSVNVAECLNVVWSSDTVCSNLSCWDAFHVLKRMAVVPVSETVPSWDVALVTF